MKISDKNTTKRLIALNGALVLVAGGLQLMQQLPFIKDVIEDGLQRTLERGNGSVLGNIVPLFLILWTIEIAIGIIRLKKNAFYSLIALVFINIVLFIFQYIFRGVGWGIMGTSEVLPSLISIGIQIAVSIVGVVLIAKKSDALITKAQKLKKSENNNQ